MWKQALFFLPMLSCSVVGPMREDVSAQNYRVGALSEEWVKIVDEDMPDSLVYRHRQHGSVIAANSLCKRYETESLKTLTAQLTQPLGSREVSLQKDFLVDGRNALQTHITGTLDGVPVQAIFTVVRKNRCLFDFSLNASPVVHEGDVEAFERFVAGFHYEGQP